MRKIISIPVIILILFSGITVNLAFHYCGGMLADKSISLLGTPASCGMEVDSDHQQTGMKRLCCENTLSSYTFNNTYIPTSVKDVSADHENAVVEVFSALFTNLAASFSPEVLVRPPGGYSPYDVDLVSICIFRI